MSGSQQQPVGSLGPSERVWTELGLPTKGQELQCVPTSPVPRRLRVSPEALTFGCWSVARGCGRLSAAPDLGRCACSHPRENRAMGGVAPSARRRQ